MTWTAKRQAYGAELDKAASEFDSVRLVSVPSYIEHAEYKHYMFVKPEQLADGWDRDRIINEIVERGVPCFQGSCSEVYFRKSIRQHPMAPRKTFTKCSRAGRNVYHVFSTPNTY